LTSMCGGRRRPRVDPTHRIGAGDGQAWFGDAGARSERVLRPRGEGERR
jgi:hypothetical protein